MSLHDLDKDHIRRLNPKPNSNDKVADRQAHGTTQNQNSIETAEADGLKFKERQILAKEDGENRAVFGFLESTNSFGLKVSKAGFDVLTAGDEELAFNSTQNVFKIVSTGTTNSSFLSTHTTQTITIAHGLSFIPIAMVYGTAGGAYFQLPYFGSFGTGLSSLEPDGFFFATTDATNLYIQCTKATYTVSSASFKYYLLQETAN